VAGGQRFGVGYASDGAELAALLAVLSATTYPVLLEERVTGPGTGIFLLTWDGALRAVFAHRREKPALRRSERGGREHPRRPDAGGTILPAAGRVQLAGLWRWWNTITTCRTAGSRARFQLAVDAGWTFRVCCGRARPHDAPLQDRRPVPGDVDHLLTQLRRSARALHLPDAPGRGDAPRFPQRIWTPRGAAGHRPSIGNLGDHQLAAATMTGTMTPKALAAYFQTTLGDGTEAERAERLAWRLYCAEQGAGYADELEAAGMPLAGRDVLDVACGWGGHAIAFTGRGARVTGSDLFDYAFPALREFATSQRVPLRLLRADCLRLPFPDASFDVVLALELIEHIPALPPFAAEVARVLRPGGAVLLSTPARLRSLVEGEPHFNLRGITWLPMTLQRLVATRLFGREYPYPITHQFLTAGSILAPFQAHGITGAPRVTGRMAERIGPLRGLAAQFFWSFIVMRKSGGNTGG
jgi:2-polyprenyl-3-methyl-5-hydroxy-6-metoxy-1,4-benzoquinol methylase